MIAAICIPHLPSLAVQITRDVTSPVIVHAQGRVVSPLSLAGMSADRASKLHPEYLVELRQPAAEETVWEMIVEAVFTTTPLIVVQGAGRLLCAPDTLPKLRRIIERTQAQAGLASTKTLASLAAVSARNGTIVTVDEDDIARFLDVLPVERLQMMSDLELTDDLIERLDLFGLQTVGRLRRLTKRHLQAQFGTVGARIHDLLRSIPDRTSLTQYQPLPLISARERFDEGTNEPAMVEAAIDMMLPSMVEELNKRCVGRLELQLLNRADRNFLHRSRILQSPTSELQLIRTQLFAMLGEMVSEQLQIWGVTLVYASLRQPLVEQQTMFRAKKSVHDIARPIIKRYPTVIKRAELADPFSLMVEKVWRVV